jgi:ApaG protein
MPASHELPGLSVKLDKLVYHHGDNLPPDRPHAFIYHLTIRNDSDRTVTLLGRKWVIENTDGTSLVVEGDKIVGETPTLAPGGHFSYNS